VGVPLGTAELAEVTELVSGRADEDGAVVTVAARLSPGLSTTLARCRPMMCPTRSATTIANSANVTTGRTARFIDSYQAV
jgi:hypothetical protein